MNEALKNYITYIILFSVAVLLPVLLFFGFIPLIGISLICVSLLLYDHEKFLYFLIFLIPLSAPFSMPGGINMILPSEALMAILILYLVLRLLTIDPIQKNILFHPVSIFILLELLWTIVCAGFSSSLEVTLKRTLINAFYIAVYYFFVIHLFSEIAQFRKLFLLYMLGLTLIVFYTLYMHSRMDFRVTTSTYVSQPFYNDHTIYGAALAFFIPFALLFYVRAKGKNKILYLSLLILLSVGLFFSFSRAAWLSLLVAGICFLFTRIRYRWWWFSILCVAMIVILSSTKEPFYEEVFRSKAISNKEDITEHVQSVTNVDSDVSNAERINRWKCALRMFADRPLTGFGPGTYQFYYGNYQNRLEMTRISTYHGTKGHAHSEYLNRLSEIGWPGCLFFVCAALAVFYTGYKMIRQKKNGEEKDIILVCMLSLITFYVHGFFNGFTDTDKIAMPVYAAMAAIVVLDVRRS